MPPVLEVQDLSKRYHDRPAVHSLSFGLSRGEIFGLLGPNGAGKTTTIGMIAGVLRPTSGSIRILGTDAVGSGRSALRDLGLAPQPPQSSRGEDDRVHSGAIMQFPQPGVHIAP